jgi:CDGSH-type Zn-finger protein
MDNQPKCAASFPVEVELEAGKTYAWCTCGLSEKQPFCDGRHKGIEGMPFKSMRVESTETKKVWLCQCKQTKNPPYCDGSHNNLPAE